MPFRCCQHYVLPSVGAVNGVSRTFVDENEKVVTECTNQYDNKVYSKEETDLRRLLRAGVNIADVNTKILCASFGDVEPWDVKDKDEKVNEKENENEE